MMVRTPRWIASLVFGCAGCVLLGSSTGCQIIEGGQLLPSPYYTSDDVQYFPPDNEFKLSREAAAMEAYKQEREASAP